MPAALLACAAAQLPARRKADISFFIPHILFTDKYAKILVC